MPKRHDAEYFREWRRKKKERIAQSLRPGAESSATVAQRAAQDLARVQPPAATPQPPAATPSLPRATVATPTLPPEMVASGFSLPKQPRRKHVKSDEQIRAYIINAMRTHGGQPKALLHILTGYIAQLQGEMKRESEESFASMVCEGRHPGKPPAGVYCRLCHDSEMAGRFGSIPTKQGPTSEDLVFPSEDLDDVSIAPLKEDK